MQKFENEIKIAPWFPRFWRRYIDDIFAIVKRDELPNILKNLNSTRYTSMQFTSEVEINGELPFLDIKLKNINGSLNYAIFRKATDNNNFIKMNSFHSSQHKHAAFHSMIHRMLKVPMKEVDFIEEWKYIQEAAKVCGLSNLILNNIRSKHEKKIQIQDLTTLAQNEDANFEYIAVPFYPKLTDKLSRVMKQHQIKLVFQNPGKLCDLLGSTKDKEKRKEFKSGIYQINCEDCDATYVGKTKRQLRVREKEHNNAIDKPNYKSSIGEHCRENEHRIGSMVLLKESCEPYKLDAYESLYLCKKKDENLLNEQRFGNLPSVLYKYV